MKVKYQLKRYTTLTIEPVIQTKTINQAVNTSFDPTDARKSTVAIVPETEYWFRITKRLRLLKDNAQFAETRC
jgi:hypothetical protein